MAHVFLPACFLVRFVFPFLGGFSHIRDLEHVKVPAVLQCWRKVEKVEFMPPVLRMCPSIKAAVLGMTSFADRKTDSRPS